MFFVYILYSPKLKRFYIGQTAQVDVRLEKHQEHFYGRKNFTTKADDWFVYFLIECSSRSQAMKIEKHVKRMKSQTYIENLKKHPEITGRLKAQCIE